MPEQLSPGVYVEEVTTPKRPIPGVDTSCSPCFEPLERLRYFLGMRLGAEDLQAEQAYLRNKLRRHNLLLHGKGVVAGLMVGAAATAKVPWRIRVDCGAAISCSGEEITLTSPVCIDLEAHRPGRAKRIFIAVRYGEALVQGTEEWFLSSEKDPRARMDGSKHPEPNRIREVVVIGCLAHRLADPWVVLAQVSLPSSPGKRLTDSAIDNASFRRAPRVDLAAE